MMIRSDGGDFGTENEGKQRFWWVWRCEIVFPTRIKSNITHYSSVHNMRILWLLGLVWVLGW